MLTVILSDCFVCASNFCVGLETLTKIFVSESQNPLFYDKENETK